MEPRAMDVLLALCSRAGTVVSAEELLQQCWGSTLYGDNPVHKTITQLRSVLGDNAKTPIYIETIRKRGYRTVADVTYASSQPAQPIAGSWLNQSPFRGLLPFVEEHASLFFGRSDAVFKLLQTVSARIKTGRALTLVLGPSGSGKTSLVRAGLLPSLMQPQKPDGGGVLVLSAITFDLAEMGNHPLFTALGSVLLDWQVNGTDVFPGASGSSLGLRLEQDLAAVTLELQHALAHDHAECNLLRLALFIDRFEALFALPHVSEQERHSFLRTLDALARSSHVVIVIACRNDFYPRLAEYPLLMEGKPLGGHFDLSPPSPAEIAQIIRMPVIAANLSFGVDVQSQTRLDDILCASAAASPDALPLLQYTLQELYRLRSVDGELSFDALHHLGGVEGAIGQRAEEVVNALSEEQRASLPRVLSLLVTLSENEEVVTSRRAPWSTLQSEAEHELVKVLVEARLFVSELVGDEPGFGVAHEALLRRWPRVMAWIETHRNALRVRGRTALLTTRWVNEGRTGDLLLPPGRQLDEARGLLKITAFSLSTDEIALIHASIKKTRLRERIRIGVMATIVSLSLLAAGLGISAIGAKQIAQQRRAEAEGLMGFMLGDFVDKLRPIGKLDLLDTVSAKALQYLSGSNAESLNPTSLTQRAKALQLIGEVNVERGNPKAASEALLAAHATLLRQNSIAPNEREVLKSLGANSFWLGRICMEQGDRDQAERYFKQYQDYSDRLHALEPDNVDWWVEQSYAHSSLGSLALERGDARSAVSEFLLSIDLKTKATAKKPQDRTLAADLANSLSWLGSTKETLGELDAAMKLYQRELEIVKRVHEAAPTDALWSNRLALALQGQARLELALGQDQVALDKYQAAQNLYHAALQQEPSNLGWQRNSALIKLEGLRIAARQTGTPDVLPQLQEIAKTAHSLVQHDSHNIVWSRLEGQVQQHIALALLDLGRNQEARLHLAQSQSRLTETLMRNPSNLVNRLALANGWLVLADIEAKANNKAAADDACQQARELIAKDAPQSSDYRLLDPLVRIHACFDNNAIFNAAKARLLQIGYRERGYLLYLSTHK
ncbi:nSTAND1 domain-containing NTPase [Collimonas silvisoli]|uniref:nSTAND1 domain-containing NTPase n=1 Tax=Collimonas silvisoli TaxID=2825884 RepID=UPI001B8CF8CC|nr:winged helix-turn-helix domain-containing protein [Collimonas silvisoli]